VVGPGLDLVVEGDGKWTPFPVWDDGDPGPWAADVVDALSARRQVPMTPVASLGDRADLGGHG